MTQSDHQRESLYKLKKKKRLALNDASETIQLNQRFRVISSFKDMKRFVKYNTIKQWTDADQKLIVC